MTTEADTESGIDQEEHYQGLEDTPDVNIEFGGLGARVGSWGSFWRKLKGLFTHAAKGAVSSGAVKDAINAQYPGLGDAAQKGMQLVEAGNAGVPQALAQLKAVADGAAAGDPDKAKAHEMLTTISEARKEAAAPAVAVGKKYKLRLPDGTTKTFKNKAELDAWVKQDKARRAAQRGMAAQRPATPRDVQQAIQRTPPQARPQLAQAIQRMQAQGRYPVQPVAAKPFNYGVQPPYGYGSPYAQGMWGQQPLSQPYGPQWYGPAQYEQEAYYQGQDYGGGDADYELAAAFAGDEQFPDEGLQGENPIAYHG